MRTPIDPMINIQMNMSEFNKLSKFIYAHYGINLPIAKKVLLESRLQKHLRKIGIPSFKKYIEQVCNDQEHEEVVYMINLVSTNKTDFFREKSHFDYMRSIILPQAVIEKEREIKIWSAASSSGEEAYTLAMTMEEFNLQSEHKLHYSIIGSDISTDVLKTGQMAIYDESRISTVPIDLKRKYFLRSKDKSHSKVRLIKSIRDKVKFSRFNLMDERYPTHESFDIIFCRNVLIYFDKETQEKVVTKLTQCLKTGGYLFLGHSESIMGMDLPLVQKIHTGYLKTR
ncbi:CheR family methyltransferase [Fulvivirga sediminis]|uniref:protein-glutamate O-methyltransferase n=1 Tax=Fulvivirga sediminis TaxID=2803949 RepID=A0A937JYP1_9BACT|nr:CheR family methyltransferase [Fulvivirga sediminis]MBL3655869.1 methyltransferase domain-containing protein [Fulvivirga sediminis]